MKENIKPCPFCGSTEIHIVEWVSNGHEIALVECMVCEAKTRGFKKDPIESHEKKAIMAWNRRANETACEHRDRSERA